MVLRISLQDAHKYSLWSVAQSGVQSPLSVCYRLNNISKYNKNTYSLILTKTRKLAVQSILYLVKIKRGEAVYETGK